MIDTSFLAGMLRSDDRAQGRFFGVTVGIVTNNQDPEGMHRVKLRFPWLTDEEEGHWARVVTPMAGAERGIYFLPEVDDEVLVAFEHGHIDYAYVLGSLWNGQDAPPESNDDGDNNLRTIRSRSGHVIRLDDTDGAEKIEIIGKDEADRICIDAAENTIQITADADITIESTNGKLILKGTGVEISSSDALKMDSSADMDLEAGGNMNISGAVINLN